MLDWFGVAALASVGTFQLMKILRTRSVSGISLPAYVALLLGIVILLKHAVAIRDPIFIVSNSYSILTNTAILFFLRRWRK